MKNKQFLVEDYNKQDLFNFMDQADAALDELKDSVNGVKAAAEDIEAEDVVWEAKRISDMLDDEVGPEMHDLYKEIQTSKDEWEMMDEVDESLGTEKDKIFMLIKELNPNAKEQNYVKLSVNQMLAILTKLRNKRKALLGEEVENKNIIKIEVIAEPIIQESSLPSGIKGTIYDEQTLEDWYDFAANVEGIVERNSEIVNINLSKQPNSLSEYIDFYQLDENGNKVDGMVDLRLSDHGSTQNSRRIRKKNASKLDPYARLVSVIVNDKQFDTYKDALNYIINLFDFKEELGEEILTEKPDIFGIETNAEIEADAEARRKAAYQKRRQIIDGDILTYAQNYSMLDKMAEIDNIPDRREFLIKYITTEVAKDRKNDGKSMINRRFASEPEYYGKPIDPEMVAKMADYILDRYKNTSDFKRNLKEMNESLYVIAITDYDPDQITYVGGDDAEHSANGEVNIKDALKFSSKEETQKWIDEMNKAYDANPELTRLNYEIQELDESISESTETDKVLQESENSCYIEYGNDPRDVMKTKKMSLKKAEQLIDDYKNNYNFADIICDGANESLNIKKSDATIWRTIKSSIELAGDDVEDQTDNVMDNLHRLEKGRNEAMNEASYGSQAVMLDGIPDWMFERKEIAEWLSEHEQAYQDALNYLGVDDIYDIDEDGLRKLEDWIDYHKELARDFENHFGFKVIDEELDEINITTLSQEDYDFAKKLAKQYGLSFKEDESRRNEGLVFTISGDKAKVKEVSKMLGIPVEESLTMVEGRTINYDDDIVVVKKDGEEIYHGLWDEWGFDEFYDEFTFNKNDGKYHNNDKDKGEWTVEVLNEAKVNNTWHYPNHMTNGSDEDREKYYAELKRIQKEATDSYGMWDGDYYVNTYTMPDGSIVKEWTNMELGIPSSIEYVSEGLMTEDEDKYFINWNYVSSPANEDDDSVWELKQLYNDYTDLNKAKEDADLVWRCVNGPGYGSYVNVVNREGDVLYEPNDPKEATRADMKKFNQLVGREFFKESLTENALTEAEEDRLVAEKAVEESPTCPVCGHFLDNEGHCSICDKEK